MEFKKKTKAGKMETYYIDRRTGTVNKVMNKRCVFSKIVQDLIPIAILLNN